jgi:hypothetical protein
VLRSIPALALLAPALHAGDWSNNGGNAERNGRSDEVGPVSPDVLWNTNPPSLESSLSIIGSTFTATVDLASTGHTFAALFAFDGPADVALGGGQRVLCADVFGHGKLYQAVAIGDLARFALSIPNDLGLCGFALCLQAAHVGGVTPFALSNALDLVVGG